MTSNQTPATPALPTALAAKALLEELQRRTAKIIEDNPKVLEGLGEEIMVDKKQPE